MSTKDQAVDYFFAALDYHLQAGEPAELALKNATNDYRYVILTQDDDRLPVSRAAEIALKHLHGEE